MDKKQYKEAVKRLAAWDCKIVDEKRKGKHPQYKIAHKSGPSVLVTGSGSSSDKQQVVNNLMRMVRREFALRHDISFGSSLAASH